MPSRNSRSNPFFGVRYTNFFIFCHFFDYVITTHTYGHDVIGHSDIWNESSRVDQQGTEVRFTLPGTDKKLWPLRYALISYFGLMLRISTVGNTLNSGRIQRNPLCSLLTHYFLGIWNCYWWIWSWSADWSKWIFSISSTFFNRTIDIESYRTWFWWNYQSRSRINKY